MSSIPRQANFGKQVCSAAEFRRDATGVETHSTQYEIANRRQVDFTLINLSSGLH
jgi:hypothetical protein